MPKLVGDARNDLVLHLEEVGDGLVEAFGPEVRSALRFDELHVDAHAGPNTLHAAFEDVAHIETRARSAGDRPTCPCRGSTCWPVVVKIPGKFDDSTFERTASSFDNPDFVDVVIHCYRFCFGIAAGDPALASLEARLAAKPKIGIPTITFDGTQDPLKPGRTANHAPMFINRHEHRVVDCGHNLPWEAPHDFADAILTVRG